MKNATILIILILTVSCSPYKKMQRILKNNPHLLTIKDTIVIKDTIQFITESVKIDSFFTVKQAVHDTIIIENDNLIIKTFIRDDTVYLDGECKSDTIYVPYEKEIIVNKFEHKEETNWYLWILILVGVIILIKKFKK